MLFHIGNAAVFADIEAVDAVVLGCLVAGVVDAASCHNLDVTVFANVERVVDNVLQAGLGHNNGNEHRFAFGARLDVDVDAGDVSLGGNLDKGGRVALNQLSVFADVEGALGHAVNICDLGEQALVDGGKIYCHDGSYLL